MHEIDKKETLFRVKNGFKRRVALWLLLELSILIFFDKLTRNMPLNLDKEEGF